ncbi:SET domain-containing protein-lysine N-methyltransferase [Stenotrophomonas indicatrix]|uniref:SET domain-containing protein-lysine N-methyltransferase n=1 Tax=Stenotrophomonas indicatrix TaxID=2045451 RepID=UPI003008C755
MPVIQGPAEAYPLSERTRTVIEHVIDNTLPILQCPFDPKRSVLHEYEPDVDQIQCTAWHLLRNELDALVPGKGESKQQAQAIAQAYINAQIQHWIRTAGEHHSCFERLMQVAVPQDGLARGRSVLAAVDIHQFQVLGPYSGAVWDLSEGSWQKRSYRDHENEALGTSIRTYAFDTPRPGVIIDAFCRGNILSLINTAQLPGQPATLNLDNNVLAVPAGNTMIFYIAIRDIIKGEELLVDYGPDYDPKCSLTIKEEPTEMDFSESITVFEHRSALLSLAHQSIKESAHASALITALSLMDTSPFTTNERTQILLDPEVMTTLVEVLTCPEIAEATSIKLSKVIGKLINECKVETASMAKYVFCAVLLDSHVLGRLQQTHHSDETKPQLKALSHPIDQLLDQLDQVSDGVTRGARITAA